MSPAGAQSPRLARQAFAGPDEFDAWLANHAGEAPGLWVVFAKKASGIPSVTLQEAIDVAMCHGWVDSLMRGIDDRRYRLRFTPRRARSTWSPRNRDRAMRLVAEGRMRPRGQAEIDAAKADGRWGA